MNVAAPRRILLIDDDRMQFRIMQATFRRFTAANYELDWAETYEEGLRRLVSCEYAACLLDYQLGEGNGLNLIRAATEAGCRTPIIFLTSETDEGVDLAAMEAGALDYLLKSEMTPGALERSIRYALKLSGTLDALHRLATRDELTGLLNRREFDRILTEEAERARRFGRCVGLVLLDIDHFKQINDRHGHPAGDSVLQQLSRRLEGCIRSVDRLARFGGEEFALVLPESDRAATLDVAERLCRAVRAEPMLAGGQSLRVSISAGAGALPEDSGDAKALVQAVDRALYAAKAAGRDRAVAASCVAPAGS